MATSTTTSPTGATGATGPGASGASGATGATGATGPAVAEDPAAAAAAEKKAASDAWVLQTSEDVGWVPDPPKDDAATKPADGDPAPVSPPPTSALTDGDKLWIRREIEGASRGMTPEQRAELNP